MKSSDLFKVIDKPEKSRPLLAALQKNSGFALNIFSDMAHSPLPIRVYNYAQGLLNKEGTLTPEEVNLVQLAVSVENGCDFCVPAHTVSALKTHKTDEETVHAIRDGRPPRCKKTAALVALAQGMVRGRGDVAAGAYEAFFAEGYTKEQVFEVLTIVAYKTITNYTSKIAGTKPNEEYAAYAWIGLKGGRP